MSRSAPRRRPRFVVDAPLVPGAVVALSESDGRHALKVLRLVAGDAVTLSSRGGAHSGSFLGLVEGRAMVAVGPALAGERAAGAGAILALGLAHGGAMDDAVRGAVEMGASQILPFRCEHGEHPPGPALAARVERWRRIAREAVKQCRRPDVPDVADVVDLASLADVPAASRIVLDPRAQSTLGRTPLAAPVLVVVGPEGGLTGGEVDLLRGRGFQSAALPHPVLRVATAAVAALALVGALTPPPGEGR